MFLYYGFSNQQFIMFNETCINNFYNTQTHFWNIFGYVFETLLFYSIYFLYLLVSIILLFTKIVSNVMLNFLNFSLINNPINELNLFLDTNQFFTIYYKYVC